MSNRWATLDAEHRNFVRYYPDGLAMKEGTGLIGLIGRMTALLLAQNAVLKQ